MFRYQFTFNEKEESRFKLMCVFLTLCYITSWMTCAVPSETTGKDLFVIKNLVIFLTISYALSKFTSTSKPLIHHFTFLSTEMVALSFCDDVVSLENKMVCNLADVSTAASNEKLEYSSSHFVKQKLKYFVSTHTMTFFQTLDLFTDCFQLDCSV